MKMATMHFIRHAFSWAFAGLLAVFPGNASGSGSSPEGTILFCATGDVMLSRGVLELMGQQGTDAPFSGIAPILKHHHLAACNLECQIGDRGFPTEKKYHFICSPDSAAGLVVSGYNLFSLANNHIFDYGENALLDTRRFLEENHFHSAGIGANRWEALQPAVVDTQGVRVAFFSFTSFWPPGLDCKMPRCAQPAKPDSQAIVACIQKVRPMVDIVIVSFHWGRELQHFPTPVQQMLGRLSIDAGADIVIGHHPHAIQTIEKYKDKFILYSLGNCIFDQKFEMGTEGLLFSCTLAKQQVSNPHVVPLIIRNCRPEPAKGRDFARIERKLRSYCAGSNVALTARSGMILLR